MPYARQCDRCKQVITPRGGLPARYCPHCGERLSGAPVEAPPPGSRRIPGAAIASLIFGILSLTPVLGVPIAILAIVLGARVKRRIRQSGGSLTGAGLAQAGIVLGILGGLFQFALFERLA